MSFFLALVNWAFHAFIELDASGRHLPHVNALTILDGQDDNFGEDDHMARRPSSPALPRPPSLADPLPSPPSLASQPIASQPIASRLSPTHLSATPPRRGARAVSRRARPPSAL